MSSTASVVKIVTAGHSTKIDGLPALLEELAGWPELQRIKLGAIVSSRGTRGGSGAHRVRTLVCKVGESEERLPMVRRRARAGRGGQRSAAIQLKVVGYLRAGSIIIGLACRASTQGSHQSLTLLPAGGDYDRLIAKLIQEEYCTSQDVERW